MSNLLDFKELIRPYLVEMELQTISYYKELKLEYKQKRETLDRHDFRNWSEKLTQFEELYCINHKNDEDIKKDLKGKEIRLFDRVDKKTGKIDRIKDVVSKHGELNCFIEGEKGRFSVETIFAYGDIQRPHFRTLIKKL